MGHRLSKIYTRTGDAGDTGLGDGSRVSKSHVRVEAFGEVDELNSVIGIVLTKSLPDNIRDALTRIQHQLFDLGGELCIPGHQMLTQENVVKLENFLDELNAGLEPLKEFILPGGCEPASYCHLARTICRRAERHTVKLAEHEGVSQYSIQYLNRLSDLLFVIARYLNKVNGYGDVLWQHTRTKQQ